MAFYAIDDLLRPTCELRMPWNIRSDSIFCITVSAHPETKKSCNLAMTTRKNNKGMIQGTDSRGLNNNNSEIGFSLQRGDTDMMILDLLIY